MRTEIGLIGFGRFGQYASRKLRRHFNVCYYDPKSVKTIDPGEREVTLDEAASKDYVVLAVPINQMPAILKAISKKVKPGAIIFDVCSVKELPVQWMKDSLPQSVSIVGTHPLFGPDSAVTSLAGKLIFLTPVRIKRELFEIVRIQLTSNSLVVHEISPTEHDLLMAKTLFMTQFVGRSLINLDLPQTMYSTENYKNLRQIIEYADNDTEELFKDMYGYNRYARKICQRYSQELQQLFTKLEHQGM
ncbi:MAG: prephenate dehydrogenase [Ignavibacteriae bacterium]|nr:prephenate dehydrogenase [Ignavibacteriota bacterium]